MPIAQISLALVSPHDVLPLRLQVLTQLSLRSPWRWVVVSYKCLMSLSVATTVYTHFPVTPRASKSLLPEGLLVSPLPADISREKTPRTCQMFILFELRELPNPTVGMNVTSLIRLLSWRLKLPTLRPSYLRYSLVKQFIQLLISFACPVGL